MDELNVLQLAQMEFNGKLLWDYFNYDETPIITTEKPDCSTILGGEICVVYDQENEIERVFMANHGSNRTSWKEISSNS